VRLKTGQGPAKGLKWGKLATVSRQNQVSLREISSGEKYQVCSTLDFGFFRASIAKSPILNSNRHQFLGDFDVR
jgi:hypothetical protein